MRLWSIDPKYLDRQGLLACWREALLAQKVLAGKTKGYVNHPQLERFRKSKNSLFAIGAYLYEIQQEGLRRGYKFDSSKILRRKKAVSKIKVTRDQIKYEFGHLLRKLEKRQPDAYRIFRKIKVIKSNSLFYIIPGKIEPWEKVV